MAFDRHGELAIGPCKEQDEQSGPRTTIHALATKRAEIGRIYGVAFTGEGKLVRQATGYKEQNAEAALYSASGSRPEGAELPASNEAYR